MTGSRVRSLSFGLAFCAASAFAAVGPHPPLINDLSFVEPHDLVDIGGGRRMNVYCLGHGSPTVIFEAGLGDEMRAWAAVQPKIAERTRACSYDRAGLGFSDPSNRPGTAANAVEDLHKLLHAAGMKPPYVLVGHSLGGMYVRLYADDYQSEVAGMVLVDPVSEEQGRRYFALDKSSETKNDQYAAIIRDKCIPAARKGFTVGSALYALCIGPPDPHFSAAFDNAVAARWSTVTHITAWWSEQANVFTTSSDQVRAKKRSFGDIPLIVLTRGATSSKQLHSPTYQLWIRLHDQLAALSTQGANQIVPGASHYIQLDRPAVVVAAIEKVLDEVGGHQTHDSRPLGP